MNRRGRPKKLPDYARLRRVMRGFRALTRAEKRLFLIEVLEEDPRVAPGLEVGVFLRGEQSEEGVAS